LEFEKRYHIFATMITELEKIQQKKAELMARFKKIVFPDGITKYVYYEIANELLISNETVKNYHVKGKIADGYMGEAICRLMYKKSKNLKAYAKPHKK